MIKTLEGMIERANKFLEFHTIEKRSDEYEYYYNYLDIPSYQAALANSLESFNRPEIGVNPNTSKEPDERYKNTLPIYSAVLILMNAPDCLNDLKNQDEMCVFAELFRLIGLANTVINLTKPAKELRSKGGQKTAKIKKEAALIDQNCIKELATDYLQKGRSKRDIVELIKQKKGFSKKKIYSSLKDHGSNLWK